MAFTQQPESATGIDSGSRNFPEFDGIGSVSITKRSESKKNEDSYEIRGKDGKFRLVSYNFCGKTSISPDRFLYKITESRKTKARVSRAHRKYLMNVNDQQRRTVFELSSTAKGCFIAERGIKVLDSQTGLILGEISTFFTCWSVGMFVYNANGDVIGKVEVRTKVLCCCGGEVDTVVLSADGKEVVAEMKTDVETGLRNSESRVRFVDASTPAEERFLIVIALAYTLFDMR